MLGPSLRLRLTLPPKGPVSMLTHWGLQLRLVNFEGTQLLHIDTHTLGNLRFEHSGTLQQCLKSWGRWDDKTVTKTLTAQRFNSTLFNFVDHVLAHGRQSGNEMRVHQAAPILTGKHMGTQPGDPWGRSCWAPSSFGGQCTLETGPGLWMWQPPCLSTGL